MEEFKKIPKHIYVMFSVIILILVSAAFWYLVNNKPGERTEEFIPAPTRSSSKTNKEIDKIKSDNREAIERAGEISFLSVSPISTTDHLKGDISAPVQVIVYDDFECPFCADFADTLREVKEHFGDQVVIVFRHFPLRSHPNALSAALASECAAEQGKFWEMHDKLFEANIAGTLGEEQYLSDALGLGLELEEFKICLNTEEYKTKVQEQWQGGVDAGITGTPGNFVNSEVVPGAVPFEDFTDSQGNAREGMKSIIDRHLAS